LGAVLTGFSCAYLILHTTFAGDRAVKNAFVRIWGFRGPLGAFIAAWGGFAMLTSAPFDNWWHDSFGRDVKVGAYGSARRCSEGCEWRLGYVPPNEYAD
jgi:hypothetical protein